MKLWKLFTLIIALVLCVSATALAYDGEILDITADSDDDPFTWDPATDEMAKYIQDNFGINFIQSETNYYNNDFTVTQLAANEGKLLCVVSGEYEKAALEAMRADEAGKDAAVIGKVTDSFPGKVIVRTKLGGTRIIQKLAGAQLPRIC